MCSVSTDLKKAQDHSPITYYSGPLRARKDWCIWHIAAQIHAAVPRPSSGDLHPSEGFQTVYILSNTFSDTVVYVGKTRDVPARFEAHRKRDWWQFVDHVELNLIACGHEGNCAEHELDRVTLIIENATIGTLRPLANKYIPSTFLGGE